MPVLYVLPYSPWSERARWMLLHHRIAFEEREHVPMLGELALRAAAGRWLGRVSVPLYVDVGVAIQDSFAIAEFVDTHGTQTKLFPPDRKHQLAEMNVRAEAIIDAGRAHGITEVMRDDTSATAALPDALRSMPLAAAMARMGSRFLARKYKVSLARAPERIREGLLALRTRLGGREYVLDRFTYADIIAATTTSIVLPVDDRYVPLSAGLRKLWTQPDLAREFDDLIQWRDRIYAKHRPVRASA